MNYLAIIIVTITAEWRLSGLCGIQWRIASSSKLHTLIDRIVRKRDILWSKRRFNILRVKSEKIAGKKCRLYFILFLVGRTSCIFRVYNSTVTEPNQTCNTRFSTISQFRNKLRRLCHRRPDVQIFSRAKKLALTKQDPLARFRSCCIIVVRIVTFIITCRVSLLYTLHGQYTSAMHKLARNVSPPQSDAFWHALFARETTWPSFAMRKPLARQSGLSRFLVHPPSYRLPRRLSGNIERAIRDDASYAIGRDWPCANLAYHSRTLLFSPLAELRRVRTGEGTRSEIYDREERELEGQRREETKRERIAKRVSYLTRARGQNSSRLYARIVGVFTSVHACRLAR